VLQAERRGFIWRNLGLAFLIQAGVAHVLFFTGIISVIMGMGGRFTQAGFVAASGYELLCVVQSKWVSGLLLASTVTFAISWLLSGLLLLIVRGMRRRWLVALFHALVFHPFAFPVGALAGLMYALRLWQLVPENFLKNNPAKITAICGGLAMCSLLLLLAKCVGLDSVVPGTIIFDDVFFGQRRPIVAGYYLADALLMGSVALLLARRPMTATVVGLVWTTFVLAETLNDLPVFADDPHMLVEELSFVLIYVVLLGHLVCHYYRTRCRHNA
jgi:hypothetical protein